MRYERFAFFLTPVFIFALTSILFKFVLKLNNSIEISSIISGKLAVCFFIGSFVYTLIIRLFICIMLLSPWVSSNSPDMEEITIVLSVLKITLKGVDS